MKKKMKILIVDGCYNDTQVSGLKMKNDGHSVDVIESFKTFFYRYSSNDERSEAVGKEPYPLEALAEFDCVLVNLNLKSMDLDKFSQYDLLKYGHYELENGSTGLEVVLRACEARVPLICLSTDSSSYKNTHSEALRLWSRDKPFLIGDSEVFINSCDNINNTKGMRWYNLLTTLVDYKSV